MFYFYLLLSVVLYGCASPHSVSDRYQEVVKDETVTTSKRTVLFFLVDGLSLKSLKSSLAKGHLPEIQSYFIGKKNQFFLARTTFPSMTFPAISSLLTESPVHQHGVFGNTILDDENKGISFEEPRNFDLLNESLRPKNIFARLKAQGFRTASFDYAFQSGSDVHLNTNDPQAAIAILEKNYKYVDDKIIKSLNLLLSESDSSKWPDFIFVHLVGLDFISHDHGPDSVRAQEYLRNLDLQLTPIFERLRQAEITEKKKIIALMSSDHGFDVQIRKRLDLQKIVGVAPDSRLSFFNEGRYAGVYFPLSWSREKKMAWRAKILAHPSIDVVAIKDRQSVSIKNRRLQTEFTYVRPEISSLVSALCPESPFLISVLKSGPMCPGALPSPYNQAFYPYLISNLSLFFQAAKVPDAVIIPHSGVSFKKEGRGQHGGPTRDETLIPLLMRNSRLADPAQVPAIWEILNFL